MRSNGIQNKYLKSKITNIETSTARNLTKVAIATEKIISKMAVNMPSP